MNMCLWYVSYHRNGVLVSDGLPCPTQNNLWPFRTVVPISHVACRFACHLNGTVISWKSCKCDLGFFYAVLCVCCLCCPVSWRLRGSISWLLTSARSSSSSCCCTRRWTASSFCDMLDEYFCSDVRFLDNCWASSTNFSSDTVDEHSFH